MLINLGFIIVGLAVLFYGGEFLITGSLRVARQYRISPFIIGATVMGFGTSAPELAVSMISAYQGSPEMAVGNVIGSNIANAALVLGLTAILVTVSIEKSRFRWEAPPLLFSTFLILALLWDLKLERWEGLVLMIGIVLYLWRSFSQDNDSDLEFEDEVHLFANRSMVYQFTLIAIGLVLLVLGAKWMVQGSVEIARSFGISEWFIGISILAVGTSLPEIVSSTLSAYRGHGEMALGNVFGSNIFNILMVLGATSAYKPLSIQEPIHPDLLITTGITCLLLLLIRLGHNLGKRDGIILLTCYGAYMGVKAGGII